jgi:hypothetical protein
MLDSDPRCAELEELLVGLSPRDELIHRFALRGISPHCRGDRLFNLRTDALKAQLRLDEDELAEILREARAAADRLLSDLAAPTADTL